MRIKELLDSKDIIDISDEKLLDIDVEDISFDHRALKEKSVFVAMRGETFDSHNVVNDVIKNGKVLTIISEKRLQGVAHILVNDSKKVFNNMCINFFGIDFSKLTKVGITGTNGKTTTSYLVESILLSAGKKVIRLGTVEYNIYGEKIIANNTTPGMYEICRMISEGLKKGADSLVMEVSSHALKQNRILGIPFDVTAFTNLTGDHLDYHKDIQDYYNSKKMLFTEKYTDRCVVNIEHEYGKRLFEEIKLDKLSYSLSRGSDIIPLNVEYSLNGIKCDLSIKENIYHIDAHLVGQHNLENILCASGVAFALGLDRGFIETGINNLKNVPGRLEKFEHKGVFYFVDYAHTDDALLNVLKALQPYKKNRIITVFGCGGDRDRTKRPRMAKVSQSYSDITIVTSDNPRTESPEKIIDDILEGFSSMENVIVIPDRREAILHSISIALNGDIVLIAGKGHEDYQIIGKEKIHFDDREELLKGFKNI